MGTTLVNFLKSLFITTTNTTTLPDISQYHNILFSGVSGTGKTVSGCFSEIERAISKKEDIYVFCREKEYDFVKKQLLDSNYTVSTISDDTRALQSHLSMSSHNTSVFYENKGNLFGTDHIVLQEQFSTRLLSVCEQLSEQNNPALIIIDGIDFYNLPEFFWFYYGTTKCPYARFVLTTFSIQDVLDYAQFRHPNYKTLLSFGQVIQMGLPSNRVMKDLQRNYQIPYSSVESYARLKNKSLMNDKTPSEWYGVYLLPNNNPQILEKQFLLYPMNYDWRDFYSNRI